MFTVHESIHTYSTHTYVHTYAYMYIYMYVPISIRMYVHPSVNTYIHMYNRCTYIHTYCIAMRWSSPETSNKQFRGYHGLVFTCVTSRLPSMVHTTRTVMSGNGSNKSNRPPCCYTLVLMIGEADEMLLTIAGQLHTK